jgi:hypothetical protein
MYPVGLKQQPYGGSVREVRRFLISVIPHSTGGDGHSGVLLGHPAVRFEQSQAGGCAGGPHGNPVSVIDTVCFGHGTERMRAKGEGWTLERHSVDNPVSHAP